MIPSIEDILLKPYFYIPFIMQYYIPGYIFFSVVSFGQSDTREYGKYLLEVVTSSIVMKFCVVFFRLNPNSVYVNLLITSAISAVCAIILMCTLKNFPTISKTIYRVIGYSNKSVLHDSLNLKNGTYVRVTYSDCSTNIPISIFGYIISFDKEKEPKYISLGNYRFLTNIIEDRSVYQKIIIPVERLLFIEIYDPALPCYKVDV